MHCRTDTANIFCCNYGLFLGPKPTQGFVALFGGRAGGGARQVTVVNNRVTAGESVSKGAGSRQRLWNRLPVDAQGMGAFGGDCDGTDELGDRKLLQTSGGKLVGVAGGPLPKRRRGGEKEVGPERVYQESWPDRVAPPPAKRKNARDAAVWEKQPGTYLRK
eukprot:134584-Rhodomonas_salina.1